MTQYAARVNLSAANYPFSSSFWGRTVIVGGLDMNFNRQVQSTEDSDKDRGIPQIFYGHNVVPTGQGFQSIGYDSVIAGLVGVTSFDSAINIKDINDNNFLYSLGLSDAGGAQNFIFDASIVPNTWASVSPFMAGTFTKRPTVSTAYIRGNQYIFFEKIGCFQYQNIAGVQSLVPVVLAGLVATNIIGITQSNGYMIAYDGRTIYWSNATLETDFVPSLSTGAGSGAVTDAKGRIIGCLPLINGFVIYTVKNAIGASYSGNIRFPFTLKEIAGSNGITDIEQVTFEANSAFHYALTSAGVQKVNKIEATELFPELSDFLAGEIFEDFDEILIQFSLSYLTKQVRTKIAFVGSRYLVISYGISSGSFTHALAYDFALKRWGKFKIMHVDCFEFVVPNFYGTRTYAQLLGNTYIALTGTSYSQLSTQQSTTQLPKKNIGFLLNDGTVKIVNFDFGSATHDGVLALGKFQHERTRRIVHQTSEWENRVQGANFNYYILPTDDGKNFLPAISPILVSDENNNPNLGENTKYEARIDALNFASVFIGSFHIVSGVINWTLGGRR